MTRSIPYYKRPRKRHIQSQATNIYKNLSSFSCVMTQTSQRKAETPYCTIAIRGQQRRQIRFGGNPRQQIG